MTIMTKRVWWSLTRKPRLHGGGRHAKTFGSAKSLPPPPLPSPLYFFFPSPPFFIPFPLLRSRPFKYSYGVWGSAVSSPSGVCGGAQRKANLMQFSHKIWNLVVAPIILIFLRISEHTGPIIGGAKCIVARPTKILVYNLWMMAGMKASPRFRESVANIRLRHQPSHIKYPLLQLHIVSNPTSYEARHLNVRQEVRLRTLSSCTRWSRTVGVSANLGNSYISPD